MTPDQMRMLFGYLLLVILGGLAAAFGIGHVKEDTSFGLMPIVTTLATLAGGFVQWAFGPSRDKPEEKKKTDDAGTGEDHN